MSNKRKTTKVLVLVLIVILVIFFVFYFLAKKNSGNLSEKQKNSILKELNTDAQNSSPVSGLGQERVLKNLEVQPSGEKVLSPEEKAALIKNISSQ